jgi:hypothetical protein
MQTQRIDVEQIRANIDLVDLVGRHVHLRKLAANEYAGPCPKCGGTDRLHVKREWFFCRQCYPPDNMGVGHDAIGFVRWLDGVDFCEACRRLGAGAVGDTTPKVRPAKKRPDWQDETWQTAAMQELDTAVKRLESPQGEPGQAYLKGRGILPTTWRAWQLGYGQAWDSTLKRYRPAILIPWRGRSITAIKYRFIDAVDGGQRYTSRGQHILCGIPLLGEHHGTLLLCEGEINAISIWQVIRVDGLPNVAVLSYGSESGVNDLTVKVASQYQRVIAWADERQRAEATMHKIPGAAGIRSPKPDGEHKVDANDLLQAGQLSAFLSAALALSALTDNRQPVTDRLAEVQLGYLRTCEDTGHLGGDYESVLACWLGLLGRYQDAYGVTVSGT